MPAYTTEALRILRDPSQFQWTAVALLGFVFYVYAVEIERRNFDAILAGIAFWSMDWINEVVNALVLHFTGTSAIWTTTGTTSFQILVGVNYEIAVLFAVAGILFVKQLPVDADARILGIPNRVLYVLGFSVFSVFVEELLHKTGSFHWTYRWWDARHPWLMVVFGYGTFYAAAAVVYDLRKRSSQLWVTGALAGTALAGLLVFGLLLRWI